MSAKKEIRLYRFHRKKYGEEMRCDAFPLSYMLSGVLENPSHREAFYCFILIEKGEVELSIAGHRAHVGPNMLVCGLPGELWEWPEKADVEGKVVIFESEFLTSAIKDTMLLQRPGFLRTAEHNPFIRLSEKGMAWIRDMMKEMIEEIKSPNRFVDLLQAQLWHLILLIEKDYQANGNLSVPITSTNYASAFINLVESEIHLHHDVDYYASRLCVTPNYLNKVCHKNLGVNCLEYIQGRIISEAKNLLKVTNKTIKEVASALGYNNNSYFVRLFRMKCGITPGEYRKSIKYRADQTEVLQPLNTNIPPMARDCGEV